MRDGNRDPTSLALDTSWHKMNSLILILVFVCPAPNLFQQHEGLPSAKTTPLVPEAKGPNQAYPLCNPGASQGLPQKIPGSADSTVPAGGLLGDGSPAPWSLDLDLFPLSCPVRDLNIFLMYFVNLVNRASQSHFLVSQQWKELKKYLRSRKSHPCQCPHSSDLHMPRIRHLKCPCSGADRTRPQPC